MEKTELEKYKSLCRLMWLTLGFYATPYNYSEESKVRHPISGEICGGIMFDGGEQARKVRPFMEKLGLKSEDFV